VILRQKRPQTTAYNEKMKEKKKLIDGGRRHTTKGKAWGWFKFCSKKGFYIDTRLIDIH
jgi:hypothetical protein